MKKAQDKEPHRFAARLAHKAPQCGAFLYPNSAPVFAKPQNFRTEPEPQRRKKPAVCSFERLKSGAKAKGEQTIAAHFGASEIERRELRAFAAREVKETNGQISFNHALDMQREV